MCMGFWRVFLWKCCVVVMVVMIVGRRANLMVFFVLIGNKKEGLRTELPSHRCNG